MVRHCPTSVHVKIPGIEWRNLATTNVVRDDFSIMIMVVSTENYVLEGLYEILCHEIAPICDGLM
jgi:hypothetical protein